MTHDLLVVATAIERCSDDSEFDVASLEKVRLERFLDLHSFNLYKYFLSHHWGKKTLYSPVTICHKDEGLRKNVKTDIQNKVRGQL